MASKDDGKLKVMNMGDAGVNVDKNPLELGGNELRQAQNAIRNPLGTGAGFRKRPGFAQFNDESQNPIYGGITIPLVDQFSGFSALYIGRGGGE